MNRAYTPVVFKYIYSKIQKHYSEELMEELVVRKNINMVQHEVKNEQYLSKVCFFYAVVSCYFLKREILHTPATNT